ncbi:MAG: ComEA family DNA-binding protein [Anaerolineae bacterium]
MANLRSVGQALARLARSGPRSWAIVTLLNACLIGVVVIALRWPPAGAVRIVAATAEAIDTVSVPVTATSPLLDINSAPAADLEALPGIGPTLAARIVAYRDEHGAFSAVEELLNVTGIGEKTLEALRPRVEVR